MSSPVRSGQCVPSPPDAPAALASAGGRHHQRTPGLAAVGIIYFDSSALAWEEFWSATRPSRAHRHRRAERRSARCAPLPAWRRRCPSRQRPRPEPAGPDPGRLGPSAPRRCASGGPWHRPRRPRCLTGSGRVAVGAAGKTWDDSRPGRLARPRAGRPLTAPTGRRSPGSPTVCAGHAPRRPRNERSGRIVSCRRTRPQGPVVRVPGLPRPGRPRRTGPGRPRRRRVPGA